MTKYLHPPGRTVGTLIHGPSPSMNVRMPRCEDEFYCVSRRHRLRSLGIGQKKPFSRAASRFIEAGEEEPLLRATGVEILLLTPAAGTSRHTVSKARADGLPMLSPFFHSRSSFSTLFFRETQSIHDLPLLIYFSFHFPRL